MAEPEAEYYIQIFLFVATILCYIVLLFCVMYGLYFCCLRSCILKLRGRRDSVEDEESTEQDRVCGHHYTGHIGLLNPFRMDKDPPSLHTDLSKFQTEATYNTTQDNNNSNAFADKKYYDIFVA